MTWYLVTIVCQQGLTIERSEGSPSKYANSLTCFTFHWSIPTKSSMKYDPININLDSLEKANGFTEDCDDHTFGEYMDRFLLISENCGLQNIEGCAYIIELITISKKTIHFFRTLWILYNAPLSKYFYWIPVWSMLEWQKQGWFPITDLWNDRLWGRLTGIRKYYN